MPFALISQIKINPRQRSEMTEAKIEELKEDIKAHGLYHPIVLDNGFNLLAGGRRLRAISELSADGIAIRFAGAPVALGEIPCSIFLNELTEIERKEIELNENLIRENLSWQDETRALAEIHGLRKAANPEQTYTETSREVIAKTGSKANPVALSAKISRAMITSQFLDDPEVKSAANEKLAFNAAARKIRNEFAAGLAELEKENTSRHTFLEGDATQLMGGLETQFRCFILDPPYGVGADKFGDAASGRHGYDDSKEAALELNVKLLQECSKLATDDAHLWLFCDIDFFHLLRHDPLTLAGWKVFRTPLIWNSGTSGHVPNQKVGIRRNYELILFAYRDPDRGLAQVLDDVVKINSRTTEGIHGAAKPTELYELLLRMSVLPGDRVLDPTCGSGTIFRAAAKYGAIATGIELDSKHAESNRGLLRELER